MVATTCIFIGPAVGTAAAALENNAAPKVTGHPRVGERLVCDFGSWTGVPKFTAEWLRNGVVVAEGSTYVIGVADEGKSLSCLVIAVEGEEEAEEESENSLTVPGGKQSEPPKDSKLPQISGNAAVGQTLTCEPGVWSGTPEIKFSYQWLRNGSKIESKTSPTYEVQTADEGTSISCKVTAHNGVGEASATSEGKEVHATQVPEDITLPEVLGTPAVEQELTCEPGSWKGEPTFAYQWLSNGSEIHGATARTYIVKPEDRGDSVACRVTATNHAGTGKPATSAGRTVGGKGPENKTPPRVTGEPKVGNALHCEEGTWSGEPTPELHYEWVLDLGLAEERSLGSKDKNLTVESGYAGRTLACEVTASNGEGPPVTKASPSVAVPAGNSNEPKNEVPPSIVGGHEVGQTLTCQSGKWAGQPKPTFEYEWIRNPGAAGEAIVGAAEKYQVTAEDGGNLLACTVTASNSVGVGLATSSSVEIPGILPSDKVLPEVSGRGAVGETLTCSRGGWEGAPTPTYTYQWVRNPGLGFGVETEIPSAKSNSYVVQTADAGYLLSCEVTATNSVGSKKVSTAGLAIPGSEPARVLSVPPQITGSPTVGEALRCSRGEWTGAPTPIFEYEWLLEGAPISSAKESVYAVVSSDAGRLISCKVIAKNREGTESAISASVHVPGVKPENTEAPQIEGNGGPGELLTCRRGTWTGKPGPSFKFEWLRDGSTIVSPTTTETYTVAQGDLGHSLSCKVIATNPEGTTEATSAPLVIVGGQSVVEAKQETHAATSAAGDPTDPTATTAQILGDLSSELTRAQRGARISSLVKRGDYKFGFTAPGTGTLNVFWYEVPKGAHVSSAKSKPKPVLVAFSTVSFVGATERTVVMRLTKSGRSLLKHSKNIKLTAKGVFTPVGGHAVTWLKTFVLTH